MKPRKVSKSAFIRKVLMDYCRGLLQYRPGAGPQVGMAFTQIRYRVMTDADGKKWDVPITEDLRPHDPDRWKHTFVRISEPLPNDQ